MRAGLDSLQWSVNAGGEEQFVKIMGVARELFHRALEPFMLRTSIVLGGGLSNRPLCFLDPRYDGDQRAKIEALMSARVLSFVDQHSWLPL